MCFHFPASAVISVVFLKETVRASDIVGKHKYLRIMGHEGHTCSLTSLLWFENILELRYIEVTQQIILACVSEETYFGWAEIEIKHLIH